MVQIYNKNIDVATLIIIIALGVIAVSAFLLAIAHIFYSDAAKLITPVGFLYEIPRGS